MTQGMFLRRNATAFVLLVTFVTVCGLSWCCLDAQERGVGFLSWASPLVSWWVVAFGDGWGNPQGICTIMCDVSFGTLAVSVGGVLLSRRILGDYSLLTGMSVKRLPPRMGLATSASHITAERKGE